MTGQLAGDCVGSSQYCRSRRRPYGWLAAAIKRLPPLRSTARRASRRANLVTSVPAAASFSSLSVTALSGSSRNMPKLAGPGPAKTRNSIGVRPSQHRTGPQMLTRKFGVCPVRVSSQSCTHSGNARETAGFPPPSTGVRRRGVTAARGIATSRMASSTTVLGRRRTSSARSCPTRPSARRNPESTGPTERSCITRGL